MNKGKYYRFLVKYQYFEKNLALLSHFKDLLTYNPGTLVLAITLENLPCVHRKLTKMFSASFL